MKEGPRVSLKVLDAPQCPTLFGIGLSRGSISAAWARGISKYLKGKPKSVTDSLVAALEPFLDRKGLGRGVSLAAWAQGILKCMI